ncbi:glycosyltransferase [Chryseobacterium sp. C-71]|uniref:glycosyltransferase n=1 Tax=Chryseobacterium sp. C-71 TaxID=2893882 RepID=UPI001E4539C1|nr:glycosyltransferase [Chryseobacterium sp. C-71]UFH32249.1 glycosyltransferase [Chryseobacterium sp. C-71]
MKINKTIVCFTASYPYGSRETYFANELEYLSQAFEKIILIPGYNPYNKEQRVVPFNVTVYDPVLQQGWRRFVDFLLNFKLKKQHRQEFFNRKVYKSRTRLKKWTLSVLSYGKELNTFMSYGFNENEVILYSYWTGKNYFIEKKLNKFRKVIRMHGGDFYEERNDGYLPLIREIYQSADLLLPISNDIYGKLIQRYKTNPSKMNLSYLGVANNSKSCKIKSDEKLRLVSCSNIYSLKRIHLIYEILLLIKNKISIQWTHIGDGDLLNDLKKTIDNKSKENIEVSFVGQKTQDEIKEIYENTYFDFFINTSEYEGLPVSIMEAFSFGIPAVATDVGGTSEIVNNNNGLLIKKDFNNRDIANEIEYFFIHDKFKKMRTEAFNMWENKFDADINYKKMITKMNFDESE